jgi:uncharacterized membrane protein
MAGNAGDGGAGSKTGGGNGDGRGAESLTSQLGLSRLGEQLQGFASAMADRGVSVVSDRLDGFTEKMSGSGAGVAGKTLKNVAKGDSAPAAVLKAGVESVKDTGLKGGLKFTNIVEELDLPVPRAVAYQAWTQFEEFPSFMKKVENVEQQEDQTVEWKAQIFWSHRSWTAEIVDQVPNERIVWRSKGEKGHVDGAVTFHELTPDLTRMLINLEYYPQGLFERTGNLWRAQGRRVRLELKFFRRYITSEVLLRQDEVEGWAGEIHDGEVAEQSAASNDQDSNDQDSSDQDSSDQDSSDQDSERRSTSGAAAKSPAKKPAATAKTAGRARPAAKKSTPAESSAGGSRSTAKRPAGSASSGRGGRAEKSVSSSARSRS